MMACAFAPSPTHAFTMPAGKYQLHKIAPKSRLHQSVEQMSSSSTSDVKSSNTSTPPGTQTRTLGSQELLMLPRQYKPSLEKGNDPFPQMSHVSAAILSSTPSIETLSQAIDEAMASHPLLRCHVEGDGEPTKRIDLFQMVREGEPNPCTFVCPPVGEAAFSSKDVLSVVEVEGEGREALDSSWKSKFTMNLDSGADWCNAETGPLWKVELHRLASAGKDGPCALMFTFNHAISDQSSANMLTDHIVSNMAAIEKDGTITKKAVNNEIPISMEESVMGMNNRFSDIKTDGFSLDTVKYVAGKAAEGFRNPVILPDDPASSQKDEGSGLLVKCSNSSEKHVSAL